MNTSYIPIYQKRGDSVVPLIIIDDAPSDAPSAAGHLVDSNGIAKAIQDAVAGAGGGGFPVVDIINTTANYTLPSGGTWAYVVIHGSNASNARYPSSGRAAGGTVIQSRGTGMFGLAIRVA